MITSYTVHYANIQWSYSEDVKLTDSIDYNEEIYTELNRRCFGRDVQVNDNFCCQCEGVEIMGPYESEVLEVSTLFYEWFTSKYGHLVRIH